MLEMKPTFFLHGPMLLGTFAKLRKATIRFATCVRPHGKNRLPLDEFSWNFIFEYYSKIQDTSDKNNGHFPWRQMNIWQYLAQFSLEWKMFHAKHVEKIETHVFCSITFSEIRAVYEVMWKNIVERCRPQRAPKNDAYVWHARQLRLQTHPQNM